MTELTPVESSNLAAVGYKDSVLTVRFHNGATYTYEGVTETEGKEIFEAESVGRYFMSVIRPKYKGVRIDLDEG